MRSRMPEILTSGALLGIAALVITVLPSSSDRCAVAPGAVVATERPTLQIAGVLLPKRTKLIIDYKRVAMA